MTVEDQNGCTDTAGFSLSELSNLRIDITDSVSILCFGDTNGRLFATPDSGVSPYTITWVDLSGGGSVSTLLDFDSVAINLGDGDYRAVVVDDVGCTDSVEASLTHPDQLIAVFSDSVLLNCNGDSDGSLTVPPTGGTPDYNYFWFRNGGGSVHRTIIHHHRPSPCRGRGPLAS